MLTLPLQLVKIGSPRSVLDASPALPAETLIRTRNGEEEEELMRLQLATRGILSTSHNNSTSSTPGVSYREKKNKKKKSRDPRDA